MNAFLYINNRMQQHLSYVLIKPSHRSQVLYTLCYNRAMSIYALTAGSKQSEFFKSVNFNIRVKNLNILTFDEYKTADSINLNSILIIMDIPTTFQAMQNILDHSGQHKQVILLLLHSNKKYINMVQKKLSNLQVRASVYSKGKLVGVNEKISALVDQNYDINRKAFYAYGEYLTHYQSNPLKRIFNTCGLDVNELAKSFGFGAAPRVKEGKFINEATRKQRNLQKKRAKKQGKKHLTKLNSLQSKSAHTTTKIKLISKTSKIAKQKQSKASILQFTLKRKGRRRGFSLAAAVK